MNLLTISEMTKSFTDKVLFNQVDFSVNEGEKIGVIGINGTGKSTLLKIISGLEDPSGGNVVKGSGVTIRFLSQNPEFEEGISIFDHVITRNKNIGNEWSIEGDAKAVLNRLGFSDYDQKVGILSGGQRKRVALAASLLSDCEILVLDEPTNHLDSDTTQWLEEYLQKRKGALVMVTHDRYFLDRVSNRIVEIDHGKIYSYNENYSGYLELKAQREEQELATERKRQSLLRVEIEWMKRGPRARSTKQKAHIARYENLRDQDKPLEAVNVSMSSLSSRMGRTTIEMEKVSKSFGDKCLIKDFTYYFLKQDRIGIVGPNGCGKSTMMNLIYQVFPPDSGSIQIGTTIKLGYFSQENEYMNQESKVIDYIKETAEFIETPEGSVSASKMLERFLFDSTLQYQQISRLSGGEKRRLYLLKILMEAPNVLILDEPTNDLDIQTLAVLEDYLDQYEGIVIAVSHDRYFLDRVVYRIFSCEENGFWRQIEGGYSEYLENKQEVEAAKKPKVEKVVVKRVTERKRKFTFQENKDYEVIDQEISQLEDKIEKLEQQIMESATDFARLNQLTDEKEQLERQLEEKMERWIYLNELYEEINQSN